MHVRTFCENWKLFKFGQHYLRYSTTSNKAIISKINNLQYSEEEQIKILHKLNQEKNDDLFKLKIPQSQIKKLEVWKNKKGSFHSMNDILDVEGMDVKNLIKICQSIVLDEPVKSSTKSTASKNRLIISPALSSDSIKNLTSAVGIYLGPAGISWARMSCPSKILNVWGYKDFSNISPKATSSENCELALSILDDIPVGDVYVFETLPGLGLQAQCQLSQIISYLQQIELNSMLLALLNTSEKHNKLLDKVESKKYENKVYYLKAKLPARLFQTWVGNEKVSAIATIEQLFSNKGDCDLPCSAIQIEPSVKKVFENQSSIFKELMSQSLLLNIAFLELCVYRNPVSLHAISPSKKKK